MRGAKPGAEHPNFKTGKWVGAKSKKRTPTPRTGATQVLREWLTNNLKIGSTFNFDTAPAATGMDMVKLHSAKTVLRRQKSIEVVDQFGNETTWRRLR